MSTTKEAGTAPVVAPASSLKERLAKKRKELESNVTFELPVPGYEDEGLWARYRALGFEDVRGIGLRVEGETDDQVTAERLSAADTLAEACVELLELKGHDDQGKPIFEAIGYRWTATAARELFDKELPEGVVARDALLVIFPYPRDMLMMTHFQDFLVQSMGYLPAVEEALRGESPGPSGPTTSR